MAWVWLTDEEIQTHLNAGTQEGFLLAIEALHYRLEFGEKVRITPLRADLTFPRTHGTGSGGHGLSSVYPYYQK